MLATQQQIGVVMQGVDGQYFPRIIQSAVHFDKHLKRQ